MQSVSGRYDPRQKGTADEYDTIAILSKCMKMLAFLPVEEMGGSLAVHSDGHGKGAAFTLELPCPTQENSHG
jgi:hypothetical protein